MSTPVIGQVVKYKPLADESAGFTGTQWPAIVVIVNGDGDAVINVFGSTDDANGCCLITKQANEGAAAGEWAV